MLNNFHTGVQHIICLTIEFEARADESLICDLDLDLKEDIDYQCIYNAYIWLESTLYNLDFHKRSSIKSLELDYCLYYIDLT